MAWRFPSSILKCRTGRIVGVNRTEDYMWYGGNNRPCLPYAGRLPWRQGGGDHIRGTACTSSGSYTYMRRDLPGCPPDQRLCFTGFDGGRGDVPHTPADCIPDPLAPA